MPTYHGSCDCDAVQFDAVIEKPAEAIVCHCNECKIRYGAFSTVYPVPDDKYTITKGEENLKSWSYAGDSGNPVPCTFCSICGTNLYREPVPFAGNKIVIVGTLKEPFFKEEIKPSGFVYGKAKLGWVSSTGLKDLD
ncbi:Mss4-like protein [Lipomyces arxii]|uniref:Mss4-like protein n=1 Tax=Lipomyces arxii TaxID=56418 RepID=UPI0034CD26B4